MLCNFFDNTSSSLQLKNCYLINKSLIKKIISQHLSLSLRDFFLISDNWIGRFSEFFVY